MLKDKNKYSEELLSLWKEWHTIGIPIGNEKLEVLRYFGYLAAEEDNEAKKKSILDTQHTILYGRDYLIKHPSEQFADESIIITTDTLVTENIVEIRNSIYEEKAISNDKNLFVGSRKGSIFKSDWDFEDGERLNYSNEFWNWVNSINSGWQNKKYYAKFDAYQQQAQAWLDERREYSPNDSEETQISYLKQERERCLENSLYGLNKFLYLKDGELMSGKRKYVAWECQAVVLYMRDLKVSLCIGKPRQIGFSSTIGGDSMMDTMLSSSYFCKFVTEKGQKGLEIFEDKVKFALDNFPTWLVPSVSHDTMTGTATMRFSVKKGKGRTKGANSKYIVEAPYETVVNGGSPNEVLIDEAGNIPIIGDMVNQGRPTMFWLNPATGLLEMKRRLYTWGTGGNMDKGGHAFESLFMQCMQAWQEKNFSFGIIPLFFNAFAKPGVTQEFLDNEKKIAYSKKGSEGDKARTIFHQTYPITIDDMFIVGANTLMDLAEINTNIMRINAKKDKPKYGYFEPIYDQETKYHEDNYVPYKITGVSFIPIPDDEVFEADGRCVVCITRDIEHNWENRYYKGTDPIFTATGHSKFSSAIKDRKYKDIPILMNFRDKDYRYCYLQSALLQMYVVQQSGYECPELVENNVGSGYIDFLTNIALYHCLVGKMQLPDYLQTGAGTIGIRKGTNSKYIVHELEKLIASFGMNIEQLEFFYQLKTFEKKVSVAGNEKYEPANKKYHFDDTLDAIVYADICDTSHQHREMRFHGTESGLEAKGYRYVHRLGYDSNFNQIRVKTKVPA